MNHGVSELTRSPMREPYDRQETVMREPLAPATRNLIGSMIERAAECWAAGDEARAEGWLTGVLRILDGRPLIDEGVVR